MMFPLIPIDIMGEKTFVGLHTSLVRRLYTAGYLHSLSHFKSVAFRRDILCYDIAEAFVSFECAKNTIRLKISITSSRLTYILKQIIKMWDIFTHPKLWVALERHNFKWAHFIFLSLEN